MEDYSTVTHKFKLLYDVNEFLKKDSEVEGVVINSKDNALIGVMVNIQGQTDPFFIPARALEDESASVFLYETLALAVIVCVGYAVYRLVK